MDRLVLVDYHNIFKLCKDKIKLDDVFAAIWKEIEKDGGGTIRIFVPNYQDSTPWRLINGLMINFGLKCETCIVLREGDEWQPEFKDVVDLSMLDWIKDNLHPDFEPKAVSFVTHDGDYIFSANEAKFRKKKEVDFWVIDPEMTSHIIKRYALVTVLDLAGISFAMPEGKENLFVTALNKKLVTGKELTEEEKGRLTTLKQIVNLLPSLPQQETDVRSLIDSSAKQIKETANIEEETAKEGLKSLAVLGAIRFYPRTMTTCQIDSSSPFFQWLDIFAP